MSAQFTCLDVLPVLPRSDYDALDQVERLGSLFCRKVGNHAGTPRNKRIAESWLAEPAVLWHHGQVLVRIPFQRFSHVGVLPPFHIS